MPIGSGDIFRVTARMEVGSDDVQNVYHVRMNGVVASDDVLLGDIADILDGAYTQANAYIAQGLLYRDIKVFSITEDRPLETVLWPVLNNGNATSSPMPFQTSPLVRFLTVYSGRQGRKYMPITSETFHEGSGQMAAAMLAGYAAYGADLIDITPIGTAEYEFGTYDPVIPLFAEYTSALVNTTMRTQRRRVQSVGS